MGVINGDGQGIEFRAVIVICWGVGVINGDGQGIEFSTVIVIYSGVGGWGLSMEMDKVALL